MPTYEYERQGVRVERLFPFSNVPERIRVGGKVFKRCFSVTTNFLVPAYMKAPGSIGSSYNACERQALYLGSERHRKDRRQAERIAARIERSESSWERKKREAAPKIEEARKADAARARAKG